ncbi:MAG: phosphoenolpyruvate carboxykinase (ATP), partial [Alphaproteobacteria bacterium]
MGESSLSVADTRITAAGWQRNLGRAQLYEEAIRRGEGVLSHDGALIVETGAHTGRAAKDKFIVRDAETESQVWWGAINQPMDGAHFSALLADIARHFADREVFLEELVAGADPDYRIAVDVVTERAWHALFARTMLIVPADPARRPARRFTILHAPSFQADPARHGCRSGTVIALDFTRRVVIIAGTAYAGEIKKSVFTILNYLLPPEGVMPMHCSANVGERGDVAIFFGLSGTGKTTLSADPRRRLIGDDEHGWSDNGVFNFEGGCYAKMI